MSQVTKRALVASLKNQLLKKPLDKVTISDITDDCGISRMTFYYHFKDIYDLIEWSCVEDARKALEGKKTYDTWQQGFLQIFQAVQENKPFIMNVYRSVSREHVETYLYGLTYDLLIGVVREQAKGAQRRRGGSGIYRALLQIRVRRADARLDQGGYARRSAEAGGTSGVDRPRQRSRGAGTPQPERLLNRAV